MLGETITNISILMGISESIIPDILTILVIIVLLIMTFKMDSSGLLSIVIIIALYTLSMALLSALGIDSTFNIFTLLGGTL